METKVFGVQHWNYRITTDLSSFPCRFEPRERFKHDLAMVRLLDPIEKTKSILPICKELTPYTPCKERMGACGVGSISDNIKNLSKTLQETYFFESTMLSNSNPYDFRWCSLQNICVDSGIEAGLLNNSELLAHTSNFPTNLI